MAPVVIAFIFSLCVTAIAGLLTLLGVVEESSFTSIWVGFPVAFTLVVFVATALLSENSGPRPRRRDESKSIETRRLVTHEHVTDLELRKTPPDQRDPILGVLVAKRLHKQTVEWDDGRQTTHYDYRGIRYAGASRQSLDYELARRTHAPFEHRLADRVSRPADRGDDRQLGTVIAEGVMTGGYTVRWDDGTTTNEWTLVREEREPSSPPNPDDVAGDYWKGRPVRFTGTPNGYQDPRPWILAHVKHPPDATDPNRLVIEYVDGTTQAVSKYSVSVL